jgi:hypothetical protein
VGVINADAVLQDDSPVQNSGQAAYIAVSDRLNRSTSYNNEGRFIDSVQHFSHPVTIARLERGHWKEFTCRGGGLALGLADTAIEQTGTEQDCSWCKIGTIRRDEG